MAQEKRPDDSGKSASSPPPSKEILDKLGAEWGDDWEAAFQAEEGELEGLTEEEDILFDFTGDETASAATPTPQGEADPEEDELPRGPSFQVSLPAWLVALPALPLRLGRKFSALSTTRKALAGGGLLLLLLAIWLATGIGNSPQSPEIIPPADPFGLNQLRPPGEPLFVEETGVEPAPVPDSPPPPFAEAPPVSEAQRQRLQLHGFFIPPVIQRDPVNPTFVHLDLTLSLQVAPGEEPAALLEPTLRDAIFRFYQSRNRETLQRYSLARGEMLRDLREWLDQHHPELAIDTISFDRYWFN
ncbi:MAG: hypothetical protein ACNA74_05130 [Desulfurivibrio sp.]